MNLNKYMHLSEEKKIEIVFNQAHEILSKINKDGFSDDWLDDVKFDAINGLEFIYSLKGFFRGLIAAKLIDLEDLNDLEAVLLTYGFIK